MLQRTVPYTFVIVALNPGDEAQQRENLGLDAQRDIELLDDVIHAQRYARPRPEHHHRRLKTSRIMPAIIHNDLGDELYRDEYLLGHMRTFTMHT